MDIKKMIGKRVLEIRLEKNLKPVDLERLIGLSNGYIGHLENGDIMPKIDTLLKLTNALNITINYLLQDIIETTPNREIEELLSIYNSMSEKKREILREIAVIINKS
ncbi:MAG: helix-turn-helix transcriptional regulator [Bacteroidota bacterium]|nr:helix-turn-helix transcriptional regulator [Bacteroidota bacterium]